jgi:hypothetical protein
MRAATRFRNDICRFECFQPASGEGGFDNWRRVKSRALMLEMARTWHQLALLKNSASEYRKECGTADKPSQAKGTATDS